MAKCFCAQIKCTVVDNNALSNAVKESRIEFEISFLTYVTMAQPIVSCADVCTGC